jgi:hypothetical protein
MKLQKNFGINGIIAGCVLQPGFYFFLLPAFLDKAFQFLPCPV